MQSQACRRVVWSRSFIAALLSLLTAVSPGVADPVASPGNVVIVVLDDVSVDELSVYAGYPLAEACGNQDQCVHPIAGCNTCSCPSFPAFPDTPFITSLANEGVIFKNAYSNPTCSPTRTTIQTGRYAFRTGVGLPGDGFGPRDRRFPRFSGALPHSPHRAIRVRPSESGTCRRKSNSTLVARCYSADTIISSARKRI